MPTYDEIASSLFEEDTRRYPDCEPSQALVYGSHSEMRRDLEMAGNSFFDRTNLRMFNARTSDPHMAAGRFWVESQRFEDEPRTYRVAWVTYIGEGYRSVERSRHFDSLAAARRARSAIAAAVKELS